MECAVITTYRCNARCMMCKAWENPSKASEEITPEIIDKIPGGHTRLNITGGEPTLRKDLEDIVAVLDKKTKRLEISTNGKLRGDIKTGSLIIAEGVLFEGKCHMINDESAVETITETTEPTETDTL